MSYSVKALMGYAGARAELDISELLVDASELIYGAVAVSPLSFRGSLTHLGAGEVLLEGAAALTVEMPCARCLAPCRLELREPELRQLIRPTRAEGDTQNLLDEDFEIDEFYTAGNVDLTGIILRTLMMELPMRVLCKEDCEGIHLDDAGRFHTEDDGHARGVPEASPFDVLKELQL